MISDLLYFDLEQSNAEAMACEQIEHDQAEYARQHEENNQEEVALEAQTQ